MSHRKIRPDQYKSTDRLQQVDWDFKGPFVESMFKNRYLLTCVDVHDGCPWVEVYPTSTRDECGSRLLRYGREVGVPSRIRSDNGLEFKGDKSSWVKARNELRTSSGEYPLLLYSVPYEPAMNGKVERFNGTIGS